MGWSGIHGRLQIVEDDIVRRIARLADFLEHDLAFALEFARHEEGAVRMSARMSTASGTSAFSVRAWNAVCSRLV